MRSAADQAGSARQPGSGGSRLAMTTMQSAGRLGRNRWHSQISRAWHRSKVSISSTLPGRRAAAAVAANAGGELSVSRPSICTTCRPAWRASSASWCSRADLPMPPGP